MSAGHVTRRHVALFHPSLNAGGAERVMVNLAIGFAGRGYRTDLVLANREGVFLALVPPSVRVIDLGSRRVLHALGPLCTYLRRQRPDVLLAALNHTNLIAMAAAQMPRARTRTVISIHSHLSKNKELLADFRDRTFPRLLRRFHRWADAIVAVSDGVAEDVATTARIPRRRIRVIHNPVIFPWLLQTAADRPAH